MLRTYKQFLYTNQNFMVFKIPSEQNLDFASGAYNKTTEK